MSFAPVALIAALLGSPVTGQNLVANPGFEEGFGADGLATNWADNSGWADLDVSYSPARTGAHSGKACQHISCPRLASGAVQMVPQSGLPIRKGAIYQVTAWARGNVGALAVQLRLAPSPYTIYVERALTLGPDWQRLQYLWRATVDDAQCRLMLRFTQQGDVWVDDLAVREIPAQELTSILPPPTPGNLLHNGDFRFGTANWLVSHGCDCWEEAKLQVVAEDGMPCLRMEVPAGVGVTLSSDAVPASCLAGTTVSGEIRASRPVQVDFGCRRAGRSFSITDRWQEVTASSSAAGDLEDYDFAHLSVTGPVTLSLRAVQLRQDGARRGDLPLRAAIIADRHPLALYHDGETVLLRLMAVREPAQRGSVLWSVEDFWGRRVMGGTWEPRQGYEERVLDATRLGRGWFRARVEWTAAGRRLRNEGLLCILPAPGRSGDATRSPFGAHFSVDPTGLALARAVGCRWLRLHPPNHTKWRTVEPQKGQWVWRDEPIRKARDAGLELVGSLDRLPRWASTAPPEAPDYYYTGFAAWLPRDWADWETYVAQTVRHHKGDIHVWEVWNEPNLEDWLVPRPGQGRAQAYAEMLRHTYPVVKREDPQATVIGGVVAGAMTRRSQAWQFAQQLIDEGALDTMDVLSFHDYIAQSVDEGGEPIQTWLPRLRERMRVERRAIPIINSEGGYATPGTAITYRPCASDRVSPGNMARWLVRQYVSQMALGVRRFFFYNFFVDGSPVIQEWEGFVEGDGQPRPNVAAYATMTWLLDGARFERTWEPQQGVTCHQFRTPERRVVVAWSRTGTTARVTLPGAEKAFDLMGAPAKLPADRRLTVTDAPLYLVQVR